MGHFSEADVNRDKHITGRSWWVEEFRLGLRTKAHVDIRCGIAPILVFAFHERHPQAGRSSTETRQGNDY